MSYIDELRQRVEDAEQKFGLIDEQSKQYSLRRVERMNAIEGRVTEQQAEITRYESHIARLSHENEQLRDMLHALLIAIEGGNQDQLGDTMRDLDAKMSVLVGTGPEEEAGAAAGEAAEADAADDPADDGAGDCDALRQEIGDRNRGQYTDFRSAMPYGADPALPRRGAPGLAYGLPSRNAASPDRPVADQEKQYTVTVFPAARGAAAAFAAFMGLRF